MGIEIKREKMQKGWKYFDIMHKDRRVARVYEDGRCTISYPSFMPYNLYLEKSDDFDSRVNNLNNFYYWCASRVLTLDRKYAKEILRTIGANQASSLDYDYAYWYTPFGWATEPGGAKVYGAWSAVKNSKIK